MFHFSYSLIVGSLFFVFMALVGVGQLVLSVRLSKRQNIRDKAAIRAGQGT